MTKVCLGYNLANQQGNQFSGYKFAGESLLI